MQVVQLAGAKFPMGGASSTYGYVTNLQEGFESSELSG
jgi:hypothetical protein